MFSQIAVVSIGFAAQIFFSARVLVQWILSERAKRVLSPSLFWILSLAGSCLMCIYGCLRNDFSIVLGQFIAYYIYVWNLRLKGIMIRLPLVIRIVLMLLPVTAVVLTIGEAESVIDSFFRNEKIPVWLIVYGSAGQVIFTLRFVYQWYYSYRIGQSVLPAGFWIISLIGSFTIVTYGIVRQDIVLIIGQSFGFVSYIRNLRIGYCRVREGCKDAGKHSDAVDK